MLRFEVALDSIKLAYQMHSDLMIIQEYLTYQNDRLSCFCFMNSLSKESMHITSEIPQNHLYYILLIL